MAYGRITRRFYKLTLATGALVSLPVALAVLWYAWSAYAHLDRALAASESKAPKSWELFHMALHDELVRDLRRVGLADRPAQSRLPTYALSLTRENLDALNAQLYRDGERSYVKGYVQKEGNIHEMEVRYRGGQPWHWQGAQKSMKLRVDKGDLIDGTRVFNLLNDPTPFGMEDQIILDLARELGLLTPEYHPAWVRLNNSDMGVFRYAAQPTEGLLRRGHRMPGAMYSGDTEVMDAKLGVGALFFSREGWQQVASRSPDAPEDFRALEDLLRAVQSASFADFATYANATLDVPRYATFDALDVVFGGSDHDYFSNHKLYFDPYRGKFEPVAWSFRGFQYEPAFNLVDHPLLVRLKMTPGYLSVRNRAVYSLLVGKASVPEVRGRADRMFEAMAPDLAADPYWDSYKLLPRVTRFHRFMVRPMNTGKWLLTSRAELHGYSRRTRFLLDALEQPGLSATAWRSAAGATRVDVRVQGEVAHRLREVEVSGECRGAFAWRADRNRNGRIDAGDPVLATAPLGSTGALDTYNLLIAGARLTEHPNPQPKRGNLRVASEPRTYSYLLTTPCPWSALALVLENEVTLSSSRIGVSVEAGEPPPAEALPPATSTLAWSVGQRSPHPWDYAAEPAPEVVRLGPGVIRFTGGREFGAHQSVVIAQGTRLELGARASLVFRGRLAAEGTTAKPIVITAAGAESFGGVALQGPATAGSRLKNVRISHGSRPAGEAVDYPGLLNVHDTSDITLEGVHLSNSGGYDDALHVAYVQNLRLYEMDVVEAAIDGVDLEMTSADIRGLRVRGAGDDCLDIMTSTLRISDSVLTGCANNAVSAGEESEVTAHGLLITHSKLGVLAKNASHARISRSLIYRVEVGLKTNRRDVHYTGASHIGASELFTAECGQAQDAARGTHIEVAQMQEALPAQGALDHLRHVLGLSAWDDLDPWVAALRSGERP
ncbi:MAG: CotH kinase family protein [Deltaproteobacteria bacterium]|nr:CotH kinase family protein [Deltaproteobacteria bacterium]